MYISKEALFFALNPRFDNISVDERWFCVLEVERFFFSEEFVAHGANVNCLAMGHKTGRVMVTGGEDRKVNLWTAGKPNCIMVWLQILWYRLVVYDVFIMSRLIINALQTKQ